MGAGVAAPGGRALSGIDWTKGPAVPRQIQVHSARSNITARLSGSKWRPEQAAASLELEMVSQC